MKNTELLKSQTNVTETDSSQSFELVKREQIDMFTAVKEEGKNWYLTLGKYKVSEEKDLEELRKMVEEKSWELLRPVIGIVVEGTLKIKEEVEKEK